LPTVVSWFHLELAFNDRPFARNKVETLRESLDAMQHTVATSFFNVKNWENGKW